MLFNTFSQRLSIFCRRLNDISQRFKFLWRLMLKLVLSDRFLVTSLYATVVPFSDVIFSHHVCACGMLYV